MNISTSERARPAVDLTNCDREPIHTPGSIQPHGFLLAVSDNGTVQMASASAREYLNRSMNEILGRPLGKVLPEPEFVSLKGALARGKLSRSAQYLLTVEGATTDLLEVIAHRSGELTILEFEKAPLLVNSDALNDRLYEMISGVELLKTADAVLDTAATHLREITGFDRILIYNFDEEGSGTVLAESRNEELPSYMHLRFPASDIPKQARRLYELNRIRIIPDVHYTPSPILTSSKGENAEELDLSGAVLRSVSPVHREYMRNMGTVSSMSVSIMMEGRLWGLISFHHKRARYIPFRLRAYCDLLTQVYANQLGAMLKQAALTRAIDLRRIQSRLLTAMAAEPNNFEGLTHSTDDVLEMMDATGAALVMEDSCTRLGTTPSEAEILGLTRWLEEREEREVYTTNALSENYAPAADWADTGSGVMALSLSRIHRSYFLWFRPELVRTVEWAGEPAKESLATANGWDIHPRRSFATWSETVRSRSSRWTHVELEAAAEFRSALLEGVLKRAEETEALVAELEFANKELEAFSYSVSHDLRAPFRHISGFSELLMEEEDSRLSDSGRRYVRTIMDSARFAGLLVDTLLNFAKIARSQIDSDSIDMNQLVATQWEETYAQEGAGRVIHFECPALPPQHGDISLLRQVFKNLFSNAIKYTRSSTEATVRVGRKEEPTETIYFVSDNGVGFDQAYVHKLFGVFQRLHRVEEFEGTGIGLANVRRIVARHGGRTWAEGKLQQGATFYFTLPLREILREGKSFLDAETDIARGGQPARPRAGPQGA